jgi:hypothetical protein
LTSWEFHYFSSILLNLLDGAIREYTFLLTIREKTFDSSVRE